MFAQLSTIVVLALAAAVSASPRRSLGSVCKPGQTAITVDDQTNVPSLFDSNCKFLDTKPGAITGLQDVCGAYADKSFVSCLAAGSPNFQILQLVVGGKVVSKNCVRAQGQSCGQDAVQFCCE